MTQGPRNCNKPEAGAPARAAELSAPPRAAKPAAELIRARTADASLPRRSSRPSRPARHHDRDAEHPPLFTVEESQALRGEIAGGHTKNLFLKDKKDQVFLVVAEEDAAIDMKSLHKRIGSARLSFGKPELLLELLGVVPGLRHAVRRHQRHGGARRRSSSTHRFSATKS